MLELDYLVGLRVGQISFGSGVTLELWADAARSDTSARLDAGSVKYASAAGTNIELEATETFGQRCAPLLALYGCEIGIARVDERANTLELVFDTGDKLTALPMAEVEGWQLACPGERFIVAVPGGDVAAWG